jgi:hypothetical protein
MAGLSADEKRNLPIGRIFPESDRKAGEADWRIL